MLKVMIEGLVMCEPYNSVVDQNVYEVNKD